MKRTEDELHREELTHVSHVLLIPEGPGHQRGLRVQDLHHDVELQVRGLRGQVDWAWENG